MKYIPVACILALLCLSCGRESGTSASPDSITAPSLDKKKPTPTPGPTSLSLSARSWQDPLDTNVPLSNNASGALTFTIPQVGHTVNYLITSGSVPRAPSGTLSASMTITASADAQFAAYDGCANPTWRLLVMAHGTNWSDPDARWWSNPFSAPLQAGAATVSASLSDPAQWSNVNGQYGSSRPTQFAAAFQDVSHYGVTFGACFFGHGVFMQSGTATAAITNYQVIP